MNPILIVIVAYALIFVVAVLLAKKYTAILNQAASQWQSTVAIPLREMQQEYVCLPVVEMLDEPIHTPENNYRCTDVDCPCQEKRRTS